MVFPIQQPVAIFLLVLVIILLAPMLFSRIKVPYIIGMIVCGVAVGPAGFNILANDASFTIFGKVGILYLMFLAAVEIDMFHLKKNLRRGLLFGLLTFSLPMAAGALAVKFVLGASWLTAGLVGSMFASHTLITYPVVARFGISNIRSSVITVCATIVAVFLALIVLAEITNLSRDGSFNWLQLLWLGAKVSVYCALIYVAYPWMVRFFFRQFAETTYQFIFILALVLLASLLAQVIGIEGILGAFFSGLVLNRFIPNRSALMSSITFAGNAIFIPYFLIGVGMLVDVRVIFHGWHVVWIAAVLIGAALASKWLAAFAMQKIAGFSAVERRLMFGLSSGKAAATLAAVMVGYQYGLLSEDMMNGAVLMILGCCAVASVFTEGAAIKLRMSLTEEEISLTPETKRINARQLVAVSNPLTAEAIMKMAVYMRHKDNQKPVTALFVRNNDDERSLAMGRNAMKTAVEVARAVQVPVDEVERYDLNIGAGLANVSKERDATDIIIGLHRRTSIVDTFYGSLIEQLLRDTNKMIVMSRSFIPVNTVDCIAVVVPAKAEYETGFRLWVERMANLASHLGCPLRFIAYKETIPYIQGVLTADRYHIDHQFSEMESWDDFILLSNQIFEDDLMVVIGARRGSISFNSDLENLPLFLEKYFKRHNLVVLYPEQFGDSREMPAPIDPLQELTTTNPSPWLLSLRRLRQMLTPK